MNRTRTTAGIALATHLCCIASSQAAPVPALEIAEECYATSASALSHFPDPSLPSCASKKRDASNFGLLDAEDLPSKPVLSSAGVPLDIRYLSGAVAITVNGHDALRLKDPGGVDDIVKAAYWHNNDWIVEASGEIYINGARIKPAPALADAFYYRFLTDRPFFFYKRLIGPVRLSYGGTIQAATYDAVAHDLCCEPGFANPHRTRNAVRFFGRRGSTWYLVTARVAGADRSDETAARVVRGRIISKEIHEGEAPLQLLVSVNGDNWSFGGRPNTKVTGPNGKTRVGDFDVLRSSQDVEIQTSPDGEEMSIKVLKDSP